jgi:hypothetical protein
MKGAFFIFSTSFILVFTKQTGIEKRVSIMEGGVIDDNVVPIPRQIKRLLNDCPEREYYNTTNRKCESNITVRIQNVSLPARLVKDLH